MKVKCIFDSKSYIAKPDGKEVGGIINRMTIDKAKDYSLDEIKENILKGITIRPSYCGSTESEWQSQQIFMIDIDNESKLTDDIVLNDYVRLVEGKKNKVRFLIGGEQHRSYEQVINHCKQINLIPTFIYTSFNHKPEQHKMRLVFVLDKAITDLNVAKKIQLYIMQSIGNVDEQCKNLNRIYYGGKEIVFDSDNILNTDSLIELSNKAAESISNKHTPKRVDKILNKLHNSPNILSTLSQNTDEYYNIKAIRERNIEYLKSKINNEPIEFENNALFWNYVYHNINMADLLEIKYPKSFKCLFHNDNNPSASIFQNNEGIWLYKCHSESCGLKMNIKQLIETLGGFKSEHRAIEFIKNIYNLSIKETDWSIEQKSNLDSILYKLDMNIFAELCPQTDKNIRYIKNLFIAMVQIAKDNIYGENYCNSDGDVVFFVSLNQLAKIMNVSPTHINRISQRIAVLVYHDLIRKLDDDKIPEEMLKKAQAISIDKGYDKRVNFYSIPSWVFEQLRNIEMRGIRWKEKGYTIKGTSYEMFYRGEGLEVAQSIYPQHKKIKKEMVDKETGEIITKVTDRTVTKASIERVDTLVDSINHLIQRNGYTTENELIKYLSNKYRWEVTDIQLKRIRGQLSILGFKRFRANKEIKEKYGITEKGYPFIIIKEG